MLCPSQLWKVRTDKHTLVITFAVFLLCTFAVLLFAARAAVAPMCISCMSMLSHGKLALFAPYAWNLLSRQLHL